MKGRSEKIIFDLFSPNTVTILTATLSAMKLSRSRLRTGEGKTIPLIRMTWRAQSRYRKVCHLSIYIYGFLQGFLSFSLIYLYPFRIIICHFVGTYQQSRISLVQIIKLVPCMHVETSFFVDKKHISQHTCQRACGCYKVDY